MNGKQKLFLIILGMFMAVFAVKFGMEMISSTDNEGPDIEVSERSVEEVVEPDSPTEEAVQKEYINVFFIGQNDRHEEVYRAVKREYDEKIDGSKIKFAINSLITGPKTLEKEKGVYTEIPSTTQILYIQELPDKVIINLSNDFQLGGGTDSLYKRIYQLIKTAKQNSNLPVYLYIDGEKAEVIGGDGIMLSQPLNDRSLDG